MSFHRGFYQNSTQKKTKTLQAKPILLQAKPFRPFKRSSTQVRRLTIAMVADLSYIPWDDPPLVPHFPFSNQTQRYQSLEAMLQNELRVPGETSRVTRPPRFFGPPVFLTQKNTATQKHLALGKRSYQTISKTEMKPTYIKKCIKKNFQTVWLSGDDKTHQQKSGYLSLPHAHLAHPKPPPENLVLHAHQLVALWCFYGSPQCTWSRSPGAC